MLYGYLQLRFSEISDKQATESIGPSGSQITLHIHRYEKKKFSSGKYQTKYPYITVKVKVNARHHRRRGLH